MPGMDYERKLEFEMKSGFAVLFLIVILLISAAAYDGIVNQPKRNKACVRMGGTIFYIYQKGDFCRTPDGRIMDIPNDK